MNAIRNEWGHGPAEYYESIVRKAGLETELERAILNWDIQIDHLHRFIMFTDKV